MREIRVAAAQEPLATPSLLNAFVLPPISESDTGVAALRLAARMFRLRLLDFDKFRDGAAQGVGSGEHTRAVLEFAPLNDTFELTLCS
jgi:hypothetical protein